MKKKLLLLTLVLSMLVSLLSSCSFLNDLGINLIPTTAATTTTPTTTADPSPKTADEFIGAIEETMEDLFSYKTNGVIDISFYIEGYEVTSKSILTSIVIDDGNEYFYYDKTEYFIQSQELGLEESSLSLDAYWDGYYYLLREQDYKTTQQLCTRISREKADELQAKRRAMNAGSGDEPDGFDPYHCTEKQFEKKSDGTYSLTLSGYTATAIDSILSDMNMEADDLLEFKLLDLAITLKADAECRLTEVKVSFVFKPSEIPGQTPSAEYTITISDHNTATKKTNELTSSFSGASNLSFIYDAKRLWNEFSKATDGGFSQTYKETLYFDGSIQTYQDKTTDVFFGVDSDGFYYNALISEFGDPSLELDYANGMMTVIQNGQSQAVDCDEKDAREFITDLILAVEYDPDRVNSISRNGDVYTLYVHTTYEEEMQELFTSFGADLDTIRQSFSFTVENDELTNIAITINADGTYQGIGLSYIIKINLDVYSYYAPTETISLVGQNPF